MASTLTLWTTLARFAQALARSAHPLILATCVKVMETMLRAMEMVAVNACLAGNLMIRFHSNANVIDDTYRETVSVWIVLV